jgi:hypothetical protein
VAYCTPLCVIGPSDQTTLSGRLAIGRRFDMETALHVLYEVLEPLRKLGLIPGWITGVVLLALLLSFVVKVLEVLHR